MYAALHKGALHCDEPMFSTSVKLHHQWFGWSQCDGQLKWWSFFVDGHWGKSLEDPCCDELGFHQCEAIADTNSIATAKG